MNNLLEFKKLLSNFCDNTKKISKTDLLLVLKGTQQLQWLVEKYTLSMNKFEYLVVYNYVKKQILIKNGQVLNHESSKLSELDLEMIVNVPCGGNWKNIPQNVINKSERLKKIQVTGGRTTLYGRLSYENPAYTITTYFNRPGNGTYVHPVHDRVISYREAARLQSFDDSYYFVGTKSDVLKQIGNAVPPKFASAIGAQAIKHFQKLKALDLFCGAGGMSIGLKKAGITPVVGSDISKNACITYKVNNPESKIIQGDITNPQIKQAILKSAADAGVDLICGGPPCQGFSLAGKRFEEDPRNKLFMDYLEIVESVKPKLVIFENVPGISSMSKGLIFKKILSMFESLGYKVCGKVLKTEEFGVPQKRRRMIIIAVKTEMGIDPEQLYPVKSKEKNISVAEAIKDLEGVACAINAVYDKTCSVSDYVKSLKKNIS